MTELPITTAYKWVSKVIASCKTKEHLESAKNLVDNFDNLHHNVILAPLLRTQISDRKYYLSHKKY